LPLPFYRINHAASRPQQPELELAAGCITRHHVHHYLGFAASQWRLFRKENPPRGKPLLYVYRVRTGQREAYRSLLPQETLYPVSPEIGKRLGITGEVGHH